ncbi:hypothetical protein E1193_13225 [Micromonospora sp. KC606]|nr:hypothetical protein E1193_13225 [Micromonospora sp. KC606]
MMALRPRDSSRPREWSGQGGRPGGRQKVHPGGDGGRRVGGTGQVRRDVAKRVCGLQWQPAKNADDPDDGAAGVLSQAS